MIRLASDFSQFASRIIVSGSISTMLQTLLPETKFKHKRAVF